MVGFAAIGVGSEIRRTRRSTACSEDALAGAAPTSTMRGLLAGHRRDQRSRSGWARRQSAPYDRALERRTPAGAPHQEWIDKEKMPNRWSSCLASTPHLKI